MDAVELPLPTTFVSKLLVSRESETRDSAAASSIGGGASIFSAPKPSPSCGSLHRDVKYPISVLEHDPTSRNKKNGDSVGEHLPTSSKYKENIKNIFGEDDSSLRGSWPKSDNRHLHKNHVKRRSSPKQAGTGITGHSDASVTTHTMKSATSVEKDKSRVIKHKRRQESKRSDRKNMRTMVKTKFDSFMSRDGLVNCHLALTANSTYGTFGFKFDDVTRNVDELSLSDLLDGGFKCPNICHEKIKKASSLNENILNSVRKAAAILMTPGAVGSSGSRKAPGIVSSTDCDEEEKDVEESAFLNQVQDQASVSDPALYQPRDILERLVLPAGQDLDPILVDSCLPLAPLKSITHMGKASLPPFPWSFSHTGSCKPTIDTSKSTTNRSTSQGRWVRIGSSSCLTGDEHSCFSNLDLKIDDCAGELKPQNFDDNTQSVECMQCDANAITRPNMSDISTSKRGSSVLSSCGHFNPMAMNIDSSDSYQFVAKESAVLLDVETLQCQGNESNLVHQSVSNLQIQEFTYTREEHKEKDTWDQFGQNHSYPLNSVMGGSKQRLSHSPNPEVFSSDYSPRLVAAAAILCEIASSRKRYHNTGKAIWPNVPSQTAMKARKTRPLIGKMDGPKPAANTTGTFKRTNAMESPEHKLMAGDDKSKNICMNNVGRGPVRWSASVENTYSAKFGRDFAVNAKPMQASQSTTAERGYDSHRKHRSATVMNTSVSTAATYVKDWRKGRHRRE